MGELYLDMQEAHAGPLRCREALGRTDDGLADFRAVLALQPSNKEAADKASALEQTIGVAPV